MEGIEESSHIEAWDSNSDYSDGDSGFGEGALSTASVQSSIFDYVSTLWNNRPELRGSRDVY